MNSSVYCSHGGGLDGYRILLLINSDCGERDKEGLASPIIAEARISPPHIPTFLLSLSHPQEEQNSLPSLQHTTTREFVIIKYKI